MRQASIRERTLETHFFENAVRLGLCGFNLGAIAAIILLFSWPKCALAPYQSWVAAFGLLFVAVLDWILWKILREASTEYRDEDLANRRSPFGVGVQYLFMIFNLGMMAFVVYCLYSAGLPRPQAPDPLYSVIQVFFVVIVFFIWIGIDLFLWVLMALTKPPV
ncbi:MAG: hypothetical protein RL095_220 [Verrucomicrobiota bacterium]|jgi:hypothetical protein